MTGKVTQADLSRSPRLEQLLAYWQERRAGRKLPTRADVDPLDFPYLLGDIALAEILDDTPSFRFRLFGSNLAVRLGRDMTGKSPSDHPDPLFATMMIETYATAVRCEEPGLYRRHTIGPTGQILNYMVLILPLAHETQRAGMLLVAVDFDVDYTA